MVDGARVTGAAHHVSDLGEYQSVAMRAHLTVLVASLFAGCSPSAEPPRPMASSVPARDAAPPGELRFYYSVSNRSFHDELTLRPPARLERKRVRNDAGRAEERCETRLSSEAVQEITAALAAPDVTAAFTEAASTKKEPLFGTDPRPGDGQIFLIERGGVRLSIGGKPCEGAPGCRESPGGVDALMAILGRIFEQQTTADCASLSGGGP